MPVNGPSTKKIFWLTFLTLGLYFFYWCTKSRAAINQSAQRPLIPTTWLLIVPAANYWWAWQYGLALEHVSYKRIKGSDVFLWYLLGVSLPWIMYSNIPHFESSDTAFNWTRAGIGFGLVYIAELIGLALFCSATQNKINRLQPVPSSSPIH